MNKAQHLTFSKKQDRQQNPIGSFTKTLFFGSLGNLGPQTHFLRSELASLLLLSATTVLANSSGGMYRITWLSSICEIKSLRSCQNVGAEPLNIGYGCIKAVEHTPAEQSSWGRGFDSLQVLGFFLLLSSVMVQTGPSKRNSITVFPI